MYKGDSQYHAISEAAQIEGAADYPLSWLPAYTAAATALENVVIDPTSPIVKAIVMTTILATLKAAIPPQDVNEALPLIRTAARDYPAQAVSVREMIEDLTGQELPPLKTVPADPKPALGRSISQIVGGIIEDNAPKPPAGHPGQFVRIGELTDEQKTADFLATVALARDVYHQNIQRAAGALVRADLGRMVYFSSGGQSTFWRDEARRQTARVDQDGNLVTRPM